MHVLGFKRRRKSIQPRLHLLKADLASIEHSYLFVCRGLDAFLLQREFFKKLFSWPQSGEDDANFAIGLEAGESNKIRCQFADLHRLAHIQYKDFTAAPDD